MGFFARKKATPVRAGFAIGSRLSKQPGTDSLSMPPQSRVAAVIRKELINAGGGQSNQKYG
jgi:hypothetical protein